MKKLILILIVFPLLSNCTQYSAMMNPSITLATGGTISQASTSFASSLAVNELSLIHISEPTRPY